MRALRVGLGLAALGSAAIAAAQVGNAIAMPIDDPKDASDGPVLAVIWSGPCKTCTETPALRRAYESARDAILSGAPGSRASLHPRIVTIISYEPPRPGGHGTYKDATATLDAVHDRLKACTIGSQGMLPRPTKTDMDSYGVGLDCPGQEMRVFMSLSFKNNQLETLYLMPDRPFFVQMASPSERG